VYKPDRPSDSQPSDNIEPKTITLLTSMSKQKTHRKSSADQQSSGLASRWKTVLKAVHERDLAFDENPVDWEPTTRELLEQAVSSGLPAEGDFLDLRVSYDDKGTVQSVAYQSPADLDWYVSTRPATTNTAGSSSRASKDHREGKQDKKQRSKKSHGSHNSHQSK
jgi:hypothetical protein